MVFSKNDLEKLVLSLIPNRTSNFIGLSCNEVAELVNRPVKHISQVLRNLTSKNFVYRSKEKPFLEKMQYFYYKSDSDQIQINKPIEGKTCNQCQRFSGLHRCILLEMILEEFPWALNDDLKKRALAVDLSKVKACPYFKERVNGHIKSKTMNAFLEHCQDKNIYLFRCPIKRCGKIIDEFSNPYLKMNIGSNTFYCPHCGSPINFAYSSALDRYQVQYWDSQFDTLQKDYQKITSCELPSRYEEDRPFGISITKERSFYLDLQNEIIYLGSKMSPERYILSKDTAYFSLRQLEYIAVKHQEDYLYLKEKLHKIDSSTGIELYSNIDILSPLFSIPSVEPSLREVGGNEIIIATKATFVPMFNSNILMRLAILDKKVAEKVDYELKEDFEKARKRIAHEIKKYNKITTLDHKTWQQLEGGIGSIMLEPFKKEAQKFHFDTPSRVKARMVRGEDFMPYRLYYARSTYASLKNGVNKEIDNIIKIELYNKLDFSWNGLRGWCHRKYPFGLFLDSIEHIRFVGLLLLHEAIINKEIKPSDFEVMRGKRYEKYYCILPNSETHHLIKSIAKKAWNVYATLDDGHQDNMKNFYRQLIIHQKVLLNKVAISSTELYDGFSFTDGVVKTIWKKLQETRDITFLTSKEQLALTSFIKRFFADELSFQPLKIVEVY